MTDQDPIDDTAYDHRRLEAELVAQDRDAARIQTDDVDETTARRLVADCIDDGAVIPIAEERILVHEPSDAAFDSIRQLAVFHQGWTAARDADEETA
ncbi:hypothetical protein [Natrinema pallidum]|uniref:DUF8069 domain-containing protein n=1 Tax=Natrinema pallidum DSM 3751 TaxID=1227495 RepID=L9YIN4_9EURY|nr:hypothetical protein [Natrinema pallidum]ELY73526.1 hypothetical protein C487_17265 [Natrinema pallidum DSM 3751]